MVWRDVNTHFDYTRCPNCNAKMRLAKVELVKSVLTSKVSVMCA
jgi:uncharacterized protein with PIN domain